MEIQNKPWMYTLCDTSLSVTCGMFTRFTFVISSKIVYMIDCWLIFFFARGSSKKNTKSCRTAEESQTRREQVQQCQNDIKTIINETVGGTIEATTFDFRWKNVESWVGTKNQS